MNKVSINRKDRMDKMRWLRTYLTPYDQSRFVYMQNGQYRFMIYAYLTDEELLIYKLKFGK